MRKHGFCDDYCDLLNGESFKVTTQNMMLAIRTRLKKQLLHIKQKTGVGNVAFSGCLDGEHEKTASNNSE